MSRLGSNPRDQLPSEKQNAYDTITDLAEHSFGDTFKYKDSQGGFVGPFPTCVQEPELGLLFVEYLQQMSKMPGLPADARETAILAVGAVFKSRYELYAHGNVAIKKVGMNVEVVQQICDGKKPQGLNEKCEIAYDVAVALTEKPGPLKKELWDKAVKAFGLQGTLAVVHFVGYYAYTSILLNATNATVPEDAGSRVNV